MSYLPNKPAETTGFVTTTLLAAGATFSSGILDVNGYSQVQTEITASDDGTISIEFYADESGTNIIRSITIPYTAAEGYQFFAAPAFGNFVRYYFNNGGAGAQTDFYYTTKILTTALSPQLLTVEGFLSPSMVSTATRPVSTHNDDRNIGVIIGQESKRKFGVNTSVGGALEAVWSYTSDWVPNQIVNQKLRIAAGGNGADTAAGAGAQSITVNFLDENLLEVEEVIVTAGAGVSADTTANCFRLISAKVTDVGTYHAANTGAITFELNGSGNIMGYIAADTGTTEQAITCIPDNKTAYVTEILVSVGQGDSADVKMFTVKNADDTTTPSSKVEIWTLEDFSGAAVFVLDTHLKLDAKTDVWFEAEKITGGGSARVSVDFNFYVVND